MTCETQKFSAEVTNVCHWIKSWVESIQFSSRTSISQRSFLILSYHTNGVLVFLVTTYPAPFQSQWNKIFFSPLSELQDLSISGHFVPFPPVCFSELYFRTLATYVYLLWLFYFFCDLVFVFFASTGKKYLVFEFISCYTIITCFEPWYCDKTRFKLSFIHERRNSRSILFFF